MLTKFEIGEPDSARKLIFFGILPAPPREYDGYRFYVTVEGGPLSASVEVNDMNPHGRSEFFHGLADDGEVGSPRRVTNPLKAICEFLRLATLWAMSRFGSYFAMQVGERK